MSQSPIGGQSNEDATRYRQGWKALNRLLHESRSFSGNEKDCAFLNLRDGRFAAVSAVTGLDFQDDGRAAAVCDWDFDGKLDLWLTARTAPRLRFVRNQFSSAGHFLAIQLKGNGSTTNRDAIGARVEVITADGQKRIASLHAGDGFLTQSSRWLHFGLHTSNTVQQIRVHWPGYGWESYPGVPADGFYWITQGASTAEEWKPPQRDFAPGVAELPKPPLSIRTVLPYRLALPEVQLEDGSDALSGGTPFDGPTVLTVWSSSCQHCLQELRAWSQDARRFQEQGVRVLAVQADLPRTEALATATQQVLDRMGFAFTSQVPTEDSLRRLDFFQRAVLDLWQPMPVPCTFLLDRKQRVAVIYKGPCSATQVLADLALLDAGFDQLRTAGLPFAGRWAGPAPEANPMRVTSQFVDHQLLPDAVNYLDRYLVANRSKPLAPTTPTSPATETEKPLSGTQEADIHFVRSVLLDSMGRWDEAFDALTRCKQLNPQDHRFRVALAKANLRRKNVDGVIEELSAAVAIAPQDIPSRRQLASLLASRQQLSGAIEHFAFLAKLTPQDAATHFNLGTLYRKSGNMAQAIACYRTAWERQPTLVPAGNNLAWILATHPDDTLRSGTEALEVAQALCERTNYSNPRLLDTLAAAQAENGRFAEAIATTEKAIQLLQAKGEEGVADLQSHLERYRQQQPYRDP